VREPLACHGRGHVLGCALSLRGAAKVSDARSGIARGGSTGDGSVDVQGPPGDLGAAAEAPSTRFGGPSAEVGRLRGGLARGEKVQGGRRGTGLSPASYASLQWRLGHLLRFFASARLDEITVMDVDRYRRTKLGEGTLSADSINKTLLTLGAIFELAIEYGLVAQNPTHGRRRRLPVSKPVAHGSIAPITSSPCSMLPASSIEEPSRGAAIACVDRDARVRRAAHQ
jgi:hypothetical protein